MAEVTITELPLAAALTGNEEYAAWQGAGTVKVPGSAVQGVAQRWALSNQSATSYTLALGDAGGIVRANNALPVTVTIPANSAVALPVGTVVRLQAVGAGAVTVAAAGGVTLALPVHQTATLRGAGARATLQKVGTDAWELAGDLAGKAFRAYRNAGLNHATADSWIKAALDTEAHDVGGVFDVGNARFAPPPGRVSLAAGAGITSVAADESFGIRITKNGTPLAEGARVYSTDATQPLRATVAVEDVAAAGDLYELELFQTVGNGTALAVGAAALHFSGSVL